jgi:hypothetical protein
MSKLEDLLKPTPSNKDAFKRFSIRIDGMPKTGKTALALTASKECPHPSKWDPKNPVNVNDILWLGFEENCLMYPQRKGLNVVNVFDWSDPSLTWEDLKSAIKALPGLKQQFADKGITTIVVDTLSTFDSLLVRDLVNRPDHARAKDKMFAWGAVLDAQYLLLDCLRATGLNYIGLVHLQPFQPMGEDGTDDTFKKAAAKQVDKIEAMSIGGIRSDFIPSMRAKAAGHWARMTDATIVTYAEERTVRAGVKQLVYRFAQSADSEFNCGTRWNLQGDQEPYLYPLLKDLYNLKDKT